MLHLFKSRVFESLIIYLLFLSLAHLKSRCTVCNRSMELVQRWSLQTFDDIVLNIWTFLPIAIAHIHASWLLACIFFSVQFFVFFTSLILILFISIWCTFQWVSSQFPLFRTVFRLIFFSSSLSFFASSIC